VTDRLSSRSTADRVASLRPTTIYRSVWEPTRPRTVRAVWNAGGERRYSRGPLRSIRIMARPFVSAVPRRVLCTKESLAGCPSRMLTPRVARAAHWRSLNQDAPTSDVLVASQAQLVGSKPSRRCRYTLGVSRACLGFTWSARTASRSPRKGQTSDDPGRLPSYREILRRFRG